MRHAEDDVGTGQAIWAACIVRPEAPGVANAMIEVLPMLNDPLVWWLRKLEIGLQGLLVRHEIGWSRGLTRPQVSDKLRDGT
jgi:hypothetical protein